MNGYNDYRKLASKSKQLFSGTMMKEAYLDGFLQAAAMYGQYIPSEMDTFNKRLYAEGLIIEQQARDEARMRSAARVMLTKYGFNKAKFRGMLFDASCINDLGQECNPETGEPTSEHIPYGDFIAVHKDDGHEITSEEYERLNSGNRKKYRIVRFFNITDGDGIAVKRVCEDDGPYLIELALADIEIGDPINKLYTQTLLSADKALVNALHQYRSEILEALEALSNRASTIIGASPIDNGECH